MERYRPTPEEVQQRIAGAQSQQDYNYWEDYEQSQIDLEQGDVDFMGRPKQPRTGDSNIERHLDNLSIFTGWLHNEDGTATYYRGGVPCFNKRNGTTNEGQTNH